MTEEHEVEGDLLLLSIFRRGKNPLLLDIWGVLPGSVPCVMGGQLKSKFLNT